MPNSYTELYFPVLVQAIVAMALAAGLLSVSFLLGKKVRNRVKDMPYESGIVPTGDARQRFSVKFYLVGMLFILFDIEAIFLYPWVVVFRELKMFAFVEMLVFVVLILSGFFYIWKKGALDWSGAGRLRRESSNTFEMLPDNLRERAAGRGGGGVRRRRGDGRQIRPRRTDARDRAGEDRQRLRLPEIRSEVRPLEQRDRGGPVSRRSRASKSSTICIPSNGTSGCG